MFIHSLRAGAARPRLWSGLLSVWSLLLLFGLWGPPVGLGTNAALAAQTVLKLATVTPDNSPWNDTLYQAVEKIAELTDARVRIKVYGNGLAGSEIEVLRKMRLGSVDAGIFTAIALKSVVAETLVMSLPYFIQNQPELQRVMSELTPSFGQKFADQGYEILGWAFSGWIYMFYQQDIRSPEQVGSVRLGVSPSEPELLAAWQALGFQVTPVSLGETFIALQNGLLTGFYSTPIGALAYQWFAFAQQMINSRIAPLLGAVLVSRRSWRRIRPEDQATIRRQIQKMIVNFSTVALEQDQKALAVMRQNGLRIHNPTAAEEQAWQEAFRSKGYAQVIGPNRAISEQLYQRAKQILRGQ